MSTAATTASQPIVFILDNVADYQTTADGLYASYEVHILSADGDALAQMVALLEGRTGLDAIHLISHGDAGVLDLGSLSLSSANLADHSAALAALGATLSPDGDFLLYGCDVAEGDVGVAFVDALAQATGADVAASVDTTGPASQGGDAVLEFQSGSIEAETLAADSFQTALGVAAIVVSQPTYDGGGRRCKQWLDLGQRQPVGRAQRDKRRQPWQLHCRWPIFFGRWWQHHRGGSIRQPLPRPRQR